MTQKDGILKCTKEIYLDDVGPRKIKSVKFTTFSGTEIRKLAEVEVWKSKFYDQNKEKVENGLLDTHMGPSQKHQGACATCHGNHDECPGHFGYLKLAFPVYNVCYLNTVLTILKCICKSCARVLLPENQRVEFLKKMRNPNTEILQKQACFKKIRDKCKASRCLRCGYINGAVKKARPGSLALVEDFNKVKDVNAEACQFALSHLNGKSPLNSRHALTIDKVSGLLKKMIHEDCVLLNLNDNPEKFIVSVIPVPPVAVRPSVLVGNGKSQEDGISSMLREIIVTNNILKDLMNAGGPLEKCLDAWELLQLQVAEYMNSEFPCVVDSKHRGFTQRIKGKQGRFRSNLCGKRTEFTGRTVISPDPNLKITEVGVPKQMAMVLTYPEIVSHHNIEKLRKCVRNGLYKYPGAKSVIHPDGSKINLKVANKTEANNLKYGHIVERHLIDGDVVLFNRQPSLHRMSIMSHRAKVMPWRTLRFNESVCNPYNADFDGDEMNMHFPQTEEARTEALMLMGVQNNLCTPKNGEILVASTQDFLTSSFLITRKDTFYDRNSFSLMCHSMGDGCEHIDLPEPSIIKPIELWTGKQLFSVLIRPNVEVDIFLNLTLKERGYTSGETMCINDGYVHFMNSDLICGQLGKSTLGNGNSNGLFSVLIRDYNTDAAAFCMNRLAKLSARWIGNHGFSFGVNDVNPGDRIYTQKKEKIEQGYDSCAELILKYCRSKLASQPGSDAAEIVESEITNVLNQIRDITGEVCKKELHWRNSGLIMSQCGSKGSVTNISQMVTCVGQQSVGGKRAPNGFMDRTLPHFTRNSITPEAKGFVANSFYSGLTATEFFFHTMGGREGLVDTAVKTADTGYMSRRLIKGLEDLSAYYDQTVRNSSGSIIQFLYGDDGMDPAKMEGKNGEPMNFDQLFGRIMATCHSDSSTLVPSEIQKITSKRLSRSDMTPEGGCSTAFKDSILKFVENKVASLEKTRMLLKLDDDQFGVQKLNILESLSARLSGISDRQLKVFLENCISRYHSKRIEAGGTVGAVGAQSIGEPGTQMTLKTFHFAGVASMNITLGVPRIKEIIDATKNIKTPYITAALECDDEKSAMFINASIKKTLLYEVAKSMEIVLNSYQPHLVVVLDMDLIEDQYMGISAFTVQQSIVNHRKLKLKKEHIQVHNASKLMISPRSDSKDPLSTLYAIQNKLPQVIVKGIPSVTKSVVIRDKEKDRGGDTNDEKPKYKLLVSGPDLLGVMGTPGVKGIATTCNHIIGVYGVLGIEAARKCIISEINETMKAHGMNIDIRHMMLLADVMTYKGEILGIQRFGIRRMKDSVLLLASFENTVEHLSNAAINGRVDQINGVTECVVLGVPMQVGTGMFKVMQRAEVPELKYGPGPLFF